MRHITNWRRGTGNGAPPLLVTLLLPALAVAAGLGPAGGRAYDLERLDVNRWLCPVINDGRYGFDPLRGGAGGYWPWPYANVYLYGAGLWFGSTVTGTDGETDTLVSFSYNPNSHGSEMVPVSHANAPAGGEHPDDRIFVYPADWPPRPRERFVTEPSVDSLVPRDNRSLQDMWCVYSDAAPENHIAPGRPLGIDVYQTVYAWNYRRSEDFFFIVYRVRNAGFDTLRQCYLGVAVDADIGQPRDDMVGFLHRVEVPGVGVVEDVGFIGDADNAEQPGFGWEEGVPGIVAYKFLEGPRDPGGNRLGLSAFKTFTRDIDPTSDQDQYLMLAGHDYRTGVYAPYDSAPDQRPGDKRFVQSCGPFELAPGAVAGFVVAVVAGPYGGEEQPWDDRPVDSLAEVARRIDWATFIYEQGWLLPGPPEIPAMTLVPGDNSVRIVWDDVAETTPDSYWERVAGDPENPAYDPVYRGYDFQGYVVYRSEDGVEWEVLARCDIADSVPADTVPYRYPPGGDSSLADSLWIVMDNSGLFYSVEDDEVSNGFEYFYCVTAYDWNYVTTDTNAQGQPVAWDTLVLRTGIVSNRSVVPRWDAANWVDPVITVVTVAGDTTNNGLVLDSRTVVPYAVTGDTHEVIFLGPGYRAADRPRIGYFVRGDGLTRDTSWFDYRVGDELAFSLPVFNGQELALALSYDDPDSRFDAVHVETGSYPGDVRPAAVASGEQRSLWAFRGSDYRLEWGVMPGCGEMTARVFDVTNGGVEVAFSPYSTTGSPGDADGWCFTDFIGQDPTDTLNEHVALLYICGGYIALNHDAGSNRNEAIGALISEIRDGDIWQAVGHKRGGTAPFHNRYRLVATPGRAAGEEPESGLRVRVVPNPYIVFDLWDGGPFERRLAFTHLPQTATIRIFTTAGELVRTLEHRHTASDGELYDSGGTEIWNLLNDSKQLVASGVYVYHVESEAGEYAGRFAVIY